MDSLAERAARWGVDREYTDARGELRSSPSEALAKILDALASGQANPERSIPSTFILRPGRPLQPPLPHLPGEATIGWRITAEGAATVAAGAAAAQEFVLPETLRPGTYRLRLTVASGGRQTPHEATLLVAPDRAFQGAFEGRLWALAVQLYGVRSKRNWGIGDFSDLSDLVEVAADHGAAGIGLNPLHVLFDDQ